ncbi:MAG TPA: DUF3566 domain-containing protein [Mycobacteriales bacterium]|nr:DUF3566 domain-containing protein [Mycobacteriales bacterium]
MATRFPGDGRRSTLPPLPPSPPAGLRAPVSRPEHRAVPVVRTRRTRLVIRRVDPWSVFLFSLVISLFLGLILIAAVALLYAALSRWGAISAINDLVGEVTRDVGPGGSSPPPVLTSNRIVGGAALLAAVDVLLFTALATLGAFLYNLCARLTGGIEVTLGERE